MSLVWYPFHFQAFVLVFYTNIGVHFFQPATQGSRHSKPRTIIGWSFAHKYSQPFLQTLANSHLLYLLKGRKIE